jgi:hypothetical protein
MRSSCQTLRQPREQKRSLPTSASWRLTGRAPLQGKLVDVNKGDFARPVIRSRYVAKEFADKRSERVLCGDPSTRGPMHGTLACGIGEQDEQGRTQDPCDRCAKAHLHAMAERAVCVALPPEVRKPGKCALLTRRPSGTRDALARWGASLAQELEKMGFLRSKSTPCCFHPSQCHLRCTVHGDDFVFVGSGADLKWVQGEVGKRFLAKVIGKLGGDAGDFSELSPEC